MLHTLLQKLHDIRVSKNPSLHMVELTFSLAAHK